MEPIDTTARQRQRVEVTDVCFALTGKKAREVSEFPSLVRSR